VQTGNLSVHRNTSWTAAHQSLH